LNTTQRVKMFAILITAVAYWAHSTTRDTKAHAKSKRNAKNRKSKHDQRNKQQGGHFHKHHHGDVSKARKVLGHEVLSKQAYDDCQMLSAEGVLMAKIDRKRFNWYIKKNLAEQIDANTIKLKFEPKGLGYANDKFYLSKMMNHCVVCGVNDHYTKHHVVPHEYRKHFPLDFKSSSSHDIVLLCSNCHESYETLAMQFKKQLAIQHRVPTAGIGKWRDENVARIKKQAKMLLKTLYNVPAQQQQEEEHHQQDAAETTPASEHVKKPSLAIPPFRVKEMMREVALFLDKEDPDTTAITQQELEKIVNLSSFKIDKEGFLSHGKLVVEAIAGVSCSSSEFESAQVKLKIDEFAKTWRRHFLEAMSPRFMNEHWDSERSLIRNDFYGNNTAVTNNDNTNIEPKSEEAK